MRIGLRLQYQRTDSSIVAFRLADFCQSLGFEVDILPQDKPINLNPVWDRAVLHDGKQGFYEWVKTGVAHVIYIGTPGPVDEILAANKAGAKAYLFCLWDLLTEEDAGPLVNMDAVICPGRCAAKLLVEKAQLENLHHIPWDPGVPITHDSREIDPKRISILWSLDHSQCISQEPNFVPVMENVLQKCPNAWLTVAYSSLLPAAGVKDLRNLAHSADGRVELIRNTSWEKHMLLYGRHDLTVWPSLIESTGMVGLCSLAMGTPVIAFDHPVIGEIVKNGKNGELVPCELKSNWLGVPYVEPNYGIFGKQLIALLNSFQRIIQMREWTSTGLKDRQEQFVHRFSKLLSIE